MLPGDPVLTVLLVGCGAALVAALGALPFAFGVGPRAVWVGAADALAGGLMLGAGYLLMIEGLDRDAVVAVAGAIAGVAFTVATQTYAGLTELDTGPEADPGPIEGYKTILRDTLHSASEGVAIGVAMVLELRLGLFLAAALAIHNVAEGMALTAFLRRLGMPVREAAGMCTVAKASQPLLAVVAFAVSPAVPGLVPAVLGFAAGALVFLVLTELAPESYERASKTLVAVLMSTATAAVLFFDEFFARRGPG